MLFDVADELVFERIGQGNPGGFDEVGGDSYGGPVHLAVGAFYDYTDLGGGGGFCIEDSYFIVDKADLRNKGVKLFQGLAKGNIKGIYWTVAFACCDFYLTVYFYLCLGAAADTFFRAWVGTICGVIVKLKERLILAHYLADHEFKASVGTFELVALLFKFLHAGNNFF